MANHEAIKTALERAVKTITLKPSVGQRVYSNTATINEGLTCHVTEGRWSLIADVPQSMGGEHQGPSPAALLRSALSSCIAIGIKMWAARRSVFIRQLSVHVETDVDARGQFGVACDAMPGFEDVRITIDIDSPAREDVLREILATSLEFSPLADVFRNRVDMSTKMRIQDTY